MAAVRASRRTPFCLPILHDRSATWRHSHFGLLAAPLRIDGLGLLMVYSATQQKLTESGLDPLTYVKRQAVWVFLGLLVLVVVTVVDYRVFRDMAPMIVVGTVALLLLVLSPLGSSSRGAQAWFQFGSFQFEPSEWAKLALIVCASTYCAVHRGDLDAVRLGTVLLLAAVPM